ncbi:ATP-dependent DNA helicase RecG [Tepidamorphus sp. 3E244]|uniref:ATP-dependent DNA helicase RecG n=1 Tax=Tepidamorphus sp. 3E244 TaxID=3385498 RepID=UPI0038FC66D4
MRPDILNPLFAPATGLAGIGDKTATLLTRLLPLPEGVQPRVIDLLLTAPTGTVDRRNRPTLSQALPGQLVTLEVVVDQHKPVPRHSRAPYRVHCHDETGALTLVFFHPRTDYLDRALPVGETRYVSGTVEAWGDRLQMVHPDRIVDAEGLAKLPPVETIYPLTAGLKRATVARAVEDALSKLPQLAEWQHKGVTDQMRWPSFADALRLLHRPEVPEDAAPEGLAWRRIAYDELLAGQLALMLVRKRTVKVSGISRPGTGEKQSAIRSALPFGLTGAQGRSVAEIGEDLASPERMVRLLQGDVGSGKTVVALMAMAQVAEAGQQSALMAPTEILARQHFATLSAFAGAAGLTVALLTGKDKQAERRAVREKLERGEINIVVGTHALFQQEVGFKSLGLVVVDEQHRFGVHQRLALSAKGEKPDFLVMSATPIPRTLLLTLYGDMDVSRLDEKPPGRKPIATRALSDDRLEDVISGVGRAIEAGNRVYWVCPLVEESEQVDASAAEDRFAALALVFPGKVALVHGRQDQASKQAALAGFQSGQTPVLVATTVVEVGVDVPEATVMVIEHAERFGLAQLHQLRGRVGRSERASSCLLVYKPPLGETARARLEVMRETEDGFRIAEEDLKLRGGGDVLGTRQSGMPGFRLARPDVHLDMLEMARDDARLVMETDPDLKGERGDALRALLYLFDRDHAVRLLGSG